MDLTQTQKEEFASVRQWIQDAAKEPDEKLRERLTQRREALSAVMNDVSPLQAAFSPGEGQWSVEQVGRHVAHFLPRCARLSVSLARGVRPDLKAKMGELDGSPRNYGEVLNAVAAGFEAVSKSIDQIRDNPNLTLTFPHPYFGELNCREWITFNFVHVNAHIRQIKRIKGSPGYPADGVVSGSS